MIKTMLRVVHKPQKHRYRSPPSRLCHIFGAAIDDERGSVSVEYALIAVIISLVVIAGLSGIGTALKTFFSDAAGGF
ncbi:Flp family type IVb pilin [Varunaivibrio sulfuroxidans]|uniref:Flp pilus assembly pilin Flp n=1 Tax=Varunaivibrio sulfuroxidans TaxID=1773489 RepID=A0A4R3JIZ9_9PROT|nr:Flp family type IVb pilin [Varunaivibrio sulfuroxidans]TCS64810.1 Flp pilus assembly pilin Flp [Varunaivibrio sulfuroxidans]WES29889.1 Flp family type IVb pilin [Varunaivibrio sulfuroxidans]